MTQEMTEWAELGFVNIVGGCCGTTPEYIKSIANSVHNISPRKLPKIEKQMRLSGLEACNLK